MTYGMIAWIALVRHRMVGTVLGTPTCGSHVIQLWVVRTDYPHLRDEVRNFEVKKLERCRICPVASWVNSKQLG